MATIALKKRKCDFSSLVLAFWIAIGKNCQASSVVKNLCCRYFYVSKNLMEAKICCYFLAEKRLPRELHTFLRNTIFQLSRSIA